LRMLGHTVDYDTRTTDNLLLEKASTNQMILLTRDEELYRRAISKRIRCLSVRGLTESERLAEVSKTFKISLEIDTAETKCPECGGDLHEASRSEVCSRIPETSLALYDKFWACNSTECGKVYWRGSHWRQIHNMLEKARLLADPITDPKRNNADHPRRGAIGEKDPASHRNSPCRSRKL
jgi:uncharacterized protein with PIN domain